MNRPTTLLYQMGKVGSTSINYALHEKGISVIHSHWMYHKYPEAEFSTLKLNLVRDIKKGKSPPLKVITPVREPLGRNLSAFFQDINRYTDKYRSMSSDEIQTCFVNNYPVSYPDKWFRKELMDLFEFDPFQEDFDTDVGYKIYNAGKHQILILRLEDAERVLPTAIEHLLGKSNVQMLKKNSFLLRHKDTFLGKHYKELKSATYPKDFIDKNYSLEYAQTFYSDKEIDSFLEKWS